MSAVRPSAALAAGLFGTLRATRRGMLLTLIYHRVLEERDPLFPSEVTAVQFDQQMSLLRRYCTPIGLGEAFDAMQAGELPPRAVAVTFDDGYRDNHAVALPILKRNRIPATFFVATSFLDGGIMWNDAVIEAVRSAATSTLQFPDWGIPGLGKYSDGAARGRLALDLITKIKHLPPEQRAGQVQRIVEQCGVRLRRDLMMSAAEVRDLHQSGMEVGAHTHTHPILKTLDAGAVREEISVNRERLQEIIGAPVTGFAYPNGRPDKDYAARDRDIVQALGFRYAVATRWGVAGPGTDPFQLPRFTPWDQHPARWIARLFLAYRNHVL